MDKLIINSKYENNTDEEYRKFHDEMNALRNHEINENYLIQILDALCQQIPKYKPDYNSHDSYMLKLCITKFKEISAETMTDAVKNKLIELIKITCESEWTAIRSEMINIMYRCFPVDYFKNLSGKELENFLSIFHNINLTISKSEDPDRHDLVRREQKNFFQAVIEYNLDASMVEQNKDLCLNLVKNFYFRSWCEIEEEAEIFSNLLYRCRDNFKNLYIDKPNEFLKILEEITVKLIKENVITKSGQDLIQRFYYTGESMLKHSKEYLELIMDKWAKCLFDLYKLDRKWMNSIIVHMARQISYVDDKLKSTAFKNCDYLVNDAMEFLDQSIGNFPTKEHDNNKSDWDYCVKSMTRTFLQYTLKTPENLERFISSLLKLISIPDINISCEIFVYSFDKIEKPMLELFKNKPTVINPLIDKCVDISFYNAETEDTSLSYPFKLPTFRFQDIFDKIIKFGKLSKAFNSPLVQDNIRLNFIKCFNEFNLSITVFLSRFVEYIQFKDYTSEQIVNFTESMNTMLDTELFKLYNPLTICIGTLFGKLAEFISQDINKYTAAFSELNKSCQLCLKNGLYWENYDGESSFNSYSMIIFHTCQQCLKNMVPYFTEFYSYLFQTIDMTDDSHSFYSSYISFVSMVPRQCSTPAILIDYIPNIINLSEKLNETTLEGNVYTLLDGLLLIISAKPEAGLNYLVEIETFLSIINNNTYLIPIITMLTVVYKEYPEKINENIINILINKFETTTSYHITNLFNVISKTKSQYLKPFVDKFVEIIVIHKMIVISLMMGIFTNILNNDLSFGEKIFPIVIDLFNKNSQDNNFCITLLTGFRSLGLLRHDLLVDMKETIERWQQSNKAYHDLCQHLLDVIADRSLAKLDNDITEQKEVIEKLDNKVEIQNEKIVNVAEDVKQQKEVIEDVSKRVENNEIQIDGIKSDFGELVDQVQEIDLKTVSNAPIWAREVSKLLNPPSDEDWKLLASRLGYSTEDIRSWSTHADPCMSLLSDWFAVRRKVEATRSVLEQLIEINRIDAATIVENALTVAESMVSDDDPIEFVIPPLVFLSYQWGVQEEVKVLREHLQKAGYRCWMDIGQMGGGDKLYEAIDRGIRGAKVFISCVTKKYSESANCKRELNLAISLHKAVIPLQMEKMEWPPIGTMGPLLTEYIFIRMFGRPGAEVVSGTFWPKDRFQELLMQIRYSCAPEYETIDNMYFNWWEPPETKTQFQLKEKNIIADINTKPSDNEKVENDNPEIFISYQWGKQEEIKKLKETLTKLGYSCWMDIYQMGGGDSLYDKIDKGLRNCLLMISCVTPKYSESPNCRREVSLCDNLKKPLIPIMLERMTWPPEGPMSMIFSQLIYISFVDTYEEQQTWNGKATNELLGKIRQIIKPKTEVPVQLENNDKISINPEKLEKPKDKFVTPVVNQNNINKASHVSSSKNNNKFNLPIAKSKTCIIS